jgi:ankyrin repeat protein
MMTALHYAAHKGHLEIVIWLVESGRADVDGVDNKRKTASDVAKDKEIGRFLEIGRFIFDHRQDNVQK